MTIADSAAMPGLQPESLRQKGKVGGAVPCLRLDPISNMTSSDWSQKLDMSCVTGGLRMPGTPFPIKKTSEF